MALQEIQLDQQLNSSLQIGDAIYFAVEDAHGVLGDTAFVGNLFGITSSGFLVVDIDASVIIPNNAFILFSKPIQINESSIKGYYADVTLENHSNKRAELFALSSEIVPSSK